MDGMNHAHPGYMPAGLARRFAALFYDTLLLLALLFIAGYLVVGLLPQPLGGVPKLLFQLWLLIVAGGYFTWFWRRGGQTLAMKTWGLKLVSMDGGPLSRRQAWLRFVWGCLSGLTFAGFVWAFFDRDRQFLHDRMAGTRIVLA
jgi:uncharacterized RDD family membrane protein YckC